MTSPTTRARLEPRAVRLETRLVHRVQHAAMHRLEPVARIGQRARDDDAHRVVDEARAHLLLELAALDAARAERLDDVRHPGTSRRARSASMNARRGSTWSPMSIEKTLSAAAASSTSTRISVRWAGSIVVSASSSASISPRPLKRLTCRPSFASSSAASRSCPNVSACRVFLPNAMSNGGWPTTSTSRAYVLRTFA